MHKHFLYASRLSGRPFVRPLTSCLLRNSGIVIFMKLGTYINYHQTICREQELTLHLHFYPQPKNSGDIAMSLQPSVVYPSVRMSICKHFHVGSITWILFGIFWWYFTFMWNRSWQCVAYKNESPHFNTIWVISPLMLFPAYSCPLCNLNTLWNIIMILHNYVEQVMTMCRVPEW